MPWRDRTAAALPHPWVGKVALLAALLALRHDGPPPATVDGGASRLGLADGALAWAAQRGELCSGGNPVGAGLRGDYFALPGFQGQAALVRTDAEIDFDASLDWPETASMQRPGSVRWTGWVKPPVSGRYRFHIGVANATVTVARHTVVRADSAATGPEAGVELAAGRYAPIEIEMQSAMPAEPAARLRLEWTVPYGARFVIPRASLFLPSETVAAPGGA